ncbi:unnamed protein product, partial [Urochloa humidicola]
NWQRSAQRHSLQVRHKPRVYDDLSPVLIAAHRQVPAAHELDPLDLVASCKTNNPELFRKGGTVAVVVMLEGPAKKATTWCNTLKLWLCKLK